MPVNLREEKVLGGQLRPNLGSGHRMPFSTLNSLTLFDAEDLNSARSWGRDSTGQLRRIAMPHSDAVVG